MTQMTVAAPLLQKKKNKGKEKVQPILLHCRPKPKNRVLVKTSAGLTSTIHEDVE